MGVPPVVASSVPKTSCSVPATGQRSCRDRPQADLAAEVRAPLPRHSPLLSLATVKLRPGSNLSWSAVLPLVRLSHGPTEQEHSGLETSPSERHPQPDGGERARVPHTVRALHRPTRYSRLRQLESGPRRGPTRVKSLGRKAGPGCPTVHTDHDLRSKIRRSVPRGTLTTPCDAMWREEMLAQFGARAGNESASRWLQELC